MFHHMAIACQDMAAIERFYSRYFGFTRGRVPPLGDTQIIFLKAGDAYLELFQAKEASPLPPNEKDGPWFPTWRHIAFKVENVDAKLAELGEAARITLGPFDFDAFIPGWRTVWVADPEGNIVEITQGYVDEESPAPFPG